MRFKGTLILLVVCLAIGSYLYFYEIKGGEQREKAKQAESQLWKLESKNIQQIDLQSHGQHVTAVRKDERDWAITAPRPLDADLDELNRLANSAANIQRENIVEPNAADLAKFGLNPAQTSLNLKTKDGKEFKISFGNNNPTGSSTYAALADNKQVFLVSNSAASAFDKKLDDLRSHAVLSFEQPEAQSLSLKSAKGDLELSKDNNDRWWIEGKERLPADSPEIRGILNALSLGRIKEFFDDNPNEYVNLNLSKPLAEVRLTYGKNKAIKHLIVWMEKSKLLKKGEKPKSEPEKKKGAEGGKSSKEGKSSSEVYLAKDESRADLFFVENDLVDKLLKSQNDLRDKALASFQRWDVDFIAFTNPKGSFSFTKSGGEWLFADPQKRKTKFEAISDVLDAMEKQVKEFVDKPAALSVYGLDKPAIHVVLKQGGNVLVDCSLGKEAKNGVYAQVKGESSIKIADKESFDKLNKAESDFIQAPEPAPSTGPANPKK